MSSFSLLLWGCSPATFFSLSFSLSQALGKPKPRLGFGFPLVFSSCWPRTSSTTRTSCSAYTSRHSSRTCCFFFFSRRRCRWSVGWYCGGRLRSCSGFFRFVVVGCCSGSVCSLFALYARCLRYCRPGQKDETSFAPCKFDTMMVFGGILGGDQ